MQTPCRKNIEEGWDCIQFKTYPTWVAVLWIFGGSIAGFVFWFAPTYDRFQNIFGEFHEQWVFPYNVLILVAFLFALAIFLIETLKSKLTEAYYYGIVSFACFELLGHAFDLIRKGGL